MTPFRRWFLLLLTAALILGPPRLGAQGIGVVGVWLSPDWIFPGTRKYSQDEVRHIAQRTLARLSKQGINTVFLETFLRGYSIAPSISTAHHQAQVNPYRPGESGIPVYPHLTYNWKIAGDEVLDPLQIFIDEGRSMGMQVHAWVHCFYWKMDNTEAMLPWHNGPSLWSQLMVSYLRAQADRLQGSPAAAPDTLALMRQAAALMEKTTDAHELEKLLTQHGLDPEGRPLGVLLRQALRAGAENPSFLLIANSEDPFPAPRGRLLRPVYVNPDDPQVRSTLVRVVGDLAAGHPGLAGIHLDHIRFPVDGQGLPESLEIQDGTYNYYNAADPVMLERYHQCSDRLTARQESLSTLVEQIRQQVPAPLKLSAAVLPAYYRERDSGRFRLGGYDFASQAWYDWKVDFVVPMLYFYHPYVIRGMMQMWSADLEKLYGRQTIQVYPGINQEGIGKSGQLQVDNWVWFDLSLARDVKLEHKEEPEDLNFGPE